MAVYRPLISQSGSYVREATRNEYDAILQQIAYLYSQNPTVVLSVVSSGGNISPTMTDRRYYTGTSQDTGNSAFGTATSQTVINDVTYDRISQSITTTTKPTYTLKPVRPDGNNGFIELTEQDVLDTYIDPIIDYMETIGTGFRGAGSYHIQNTVSHANSTVVGTGIVYQDTRSVGYGSYPTLTGSGQQFTNVSSVNTYRLFQINGSSPSYRTPLIADGTDGLRHMTTSEFDTYFQGLIRWCIYGETGYTLRYVVDTGTPGSSTGSQKGDVMTDTNITGSQQADRVTDQGDTDPNDYISQLQPSGAASTREVYTLKIERT